MERLKNNEPLTPDSSDLTINISSDTEIQSEPNPNLDEYDDLVRHSESDFEVIVILDRNSCLYSNLTSIQTNLRPTPLDDWLTQFEHEVVGRLHYLFEACASNIKLYKVCALANNFRRWIDVSYEVLEITFLKEAKRNSHARLSSIVEPLLQKVPQTLLLSAPVMTPPPSPVQAPSVTSESTLEVGSVSGANKTLNCEEFILKALERLSTKNSEVKEMTSKLEGILGDILSRLSPPPKP